MIQPLVEFIQKDIPVTFLRNVTWVLVNLCRHKEPPLPLAAVQEILPALKCLIAYTDVTVSRRRFVFSAKAFLQILVDCTWALAYLLDCGNSMIQVRRKVDPLIHEGMSRFVQLIVDAGLIPHVVHLLNHNEIKIVTAGRKNLSRPRERSVSALFSVHLQR